MRRSLSEARNAPMTSEVSDRHLLLRACRAFLVPVARFLLRSGIGFSEFVDVARMAFVQVAAEDYGIRGRQTNTSRIAAMTGISRRQVSRVRRYLNEYLEDPRVGLTPVGDVLHHWHTDTAFLDEDGNPRCLAMQGKADSFEELVRQVASDVPPGAMRAELMRCGAVLIDESKDAIRAIRRHAVPSAFDEKLVTSISFNLRGLAANIAHNSDPARGRDGWIERFVYSPRLSPEARERARKAAREQITRFSEDLDDGFAELETDDQDASPIGSLKRVGIGIYYYEDE